MNLIGLWQQYGAIIIALIIVGVAGLWLWFTDRKRATEVALILAQQIVALVLTTARAVASEIPDEFVKGKAHELYELLPAWVQRLLPSTVFVGWALQIWARFKLELERTGDARVAMRRAVSSY